MTGRKAPRGVARTIVGLLLVLATLFLSGCQSTPATTEFAGPDWSRGKLLGVSAINNRPGIAWDSAGKNAIVTWLTTSEGAWRFQLARVDDRGGIVSSQTLSLALRLPTHAQFLRDGAGGFHLFWLDSESGGRPGLYHAQVTAQGEVISAPLKISSAESDVTGYGMTEALAGTLDIFWSDVTKGAEGLYHARLSANDEFAVAPHALGAGGEHPSPATDASGTVHLAWHKTGTLGSEQILYATFDPKTLTLSQETEMDAFPTGMGLSLYPPEVALDNDHVYLVWSLERRAGGLAPGTAQTTLATFPIGHPEQHAESELLLPATLQRDYPTASGVFNYRRLAPLPKTVRGISDYTYMPFAIPCQRAEAGLMLSTYMAPPRRQGEIQIAFVALGGGEVKGFQTAARTRSSSMRPVAVADETGAIHLVWLDAAGFGAYEVYYASTSPSVKAALNAITVDDVITSVVGRTWSMAAALSFFPMLVVWMFLPFAWLVLFYLLRPDSDLRTRTGWVGLGVAMALYLVSKLFMLPAFLWYAPFLDIAPANLENLLVFGFPVLIAAIGLLAMRSYIRRSDRKVVLIAFAIFAFTDSILSLILYMPNVMG